MVRVKRVLYLLAGALIVVGCGGGGGGTQEDKIPETPQEAQKSIVGTWANCVKDEVDQRYYYSEVTFYGDQTGYFHEYLSKDSQCNSVDKGDRYAQGFRYEITKKVSDTIFEINVTSKDSDTGKSDSSIVRVKFEEGKKIRFADNDDNYKFKDDPASLFAEVSGSLPATTSEAKEKLIGMWSVCTLEPTFGSSTVRSRKINLTYEANGTLLIKREDFENDTCSGNTLDTSEVSLAYEVGDKTTVRMEHWRLSIM